MSKKEGNYWLLPTNDNNMKEVFRMFLKCVELQHHGYETRNEIAEAYSEYNPKIKVSSCKKYMNNFERLNLIGVERGKEQSFIPTYEGEMSLELYSLYKEEKSISTLRQFEQSVLTNLCSNYNVEIRGNIAYPFNYLMTFLRGMNGEIYMPELLLLFTTSNFHEVEKIMSFAREYRKSEFNRSMFFNYLGDLRKNIGLSDDDINRIIQKYIFIPHLILNSLGIVERESFDGEKEFITSSRKIDFTERIFIK